MKFCVYVCLSFSSSNKLESTHTYTHTLALSVWNTSSKKFCGCFGVFVCVHHDKSIMFLSFRCCLFPASSRHDFVFILFFYSRKNATFIQIHFYRFDFTFEYYLLLMLTHSTERERETYTHTIFVWDRRDETYHLYRHVFLQNNFWNMILLLYKLNKCTLYNVQNIRIYVWLSRLPATFVFFCVEKWQICVFLLCHSPFLILCMP